MCRLNPEKAGECMRRLLIADPGGEYSRILTRELGERFHIQCCTTGEKALELLKSFAPDGIVLDLNMPEIDGVTFLRRAREAGCNAAVLAITTLFSPYVQQTLQELAVAYVMRQPCDSRALVERTEDLLRFPGECRCTEPYTRITGALLALGIRPGYDGYSFLLPAILYRARHPRAAVTKELYPAVAEVCGASPIQVERDIRLAIESGWENGSREVWERVLPGQTKRPSNDLFLHRMAELLSLEE